MKTCREGVKENDKGEEEKEGRREEKWWENKRRIRMRGRRRRRTGRWPSTNGDREIWMSFLTFPTGSHKKKKKRHTPLFLTLPSLSPPPPFTHPSLSYSPFPSSLPPSFTLLPLPWSSSSSASPFTQAFTSFFLSCPFVFHFSSSHLPSLFIHFSPERLHYFPLIYPSLFFLSLSFTFSPHLPFLFHPSTHPLLGRRWLSA